MLTQHNEFRHAARRLLRSRAFTTAGALTLALGVGATATIFTVVNRVILRDLPYVEAGRLIWMDHVAPGIDLPGSPGLSQGLYHHYRHNLRTISDLAIWRRDQWTLTGDGTAERLTGIATTASLSDALKVPPALGRWFTEKEADDNARVVMISHTLWTTRFGRERNVIGKLIRLNGSPREIIGVLPASLAFPDPTIQLYVPEAINKEQIRTAGGFNYQSIARLVGSSTVAHVKREMDREIKRLPEVLTSDPVINEVVHGAKLGGAPEPLKDRIVGPVRKTMWILLAMVGLVLLIACANVANLFLVRSEERQREVAVRRAIGATRSGIIGYFLAESAILSLIGGLLGLGFAAAAVKLLIRYGPENLPRMNEIAVDGSTIGWVLLLSISASFVFALIPMMRGTSSMLSTLREGGRGQTAGRTRFRVRNALMAAQVALALVLLVVSGLMVKSFLRLRAVDPGFSAENLLTFNVSLTRAEFPDRAAAVRFHEQTMERIAAIPGVSRVGVTTCLPVTGTCWGDPIQVRGRQIQRGEVPPLVQIRRALPGFFETMQTRVLQGRAFEPADHQNNVGTVVMSKRAAELYFADEDALGKQVGFMFYPGAESLWYTIVGVVEDSPVEEIGEPPYPVVYFSATDPGTREIGNSMHAAAYAIRTAVPPMTITNAVRRAVAEINPNVALGRVQSMEMIVAQNTARMAFTMMLLLIAGSIALLLGAVGIYGVISYVVGQRRNEIGVRMALGARPNDVSGMVLKQSGGVVGIGILAGLGGAFALSRVLSSLLFEVSPSDLVTYGVVTVFLLAIAGLASWLPARRAAGLDPLIALKTE
jgi:putative ABC transport system permease protein